MKIKNKGKIDLRALKYKNEAHQKAFETFLDEMYLSQKEKERPSKLLRRQIAFAYLLALYEADYEKYEGEGFYFEIGEELSLGGPTYLLDPRYGLRNKEYEKIVPIACELLKESVVDEKWIEKVTKAHIWTEKIKPYLEECLRICNHQSLLKDK